MTIANHWRNRYAPFEGVHSLAADIQWLLAVFHMKTDKELVAMHLAAACEDPAIWSVATPGQIVAERRRLTRAGFVWCAGRKGFRRLWSVDGEDA
jgi:hypothetical protein